jgi:hypothetical protein
MLRAATLFVLLLVCCILVAVPLGCSKSDPSGLMNNIPPETQLSFAPATLPRLSALARPSALSN